MQQTTKISYVTLVRIPSGRAHGYAIMKMCEEFAAEGAEVELIAPTKHRGGITKDAFEYFGIDRTFSIKKLWATDLVGLFEKSRMAFMVDQIFFLFSLCTRRFDTILYTRDYQVALCARAKNIVLELHTIPDRKFLFLKAAARARRLVVISEGLRQALVDLGIRTEKILVAPDAVDLSEFAITPSRDEWRTHHVDPDKKIALYAGHFYGWKGAGTLAEAADFLPNEVAVVLMGGVDEELKSFKRSYTDPRVHIIGMQPREKIPAYLMTADVVILPNSAKEKISSHYTSPLKLFQYMASGVPIIASDLPSIREILSDEMVFWFIPDDARSLARQIEYVLTHHDEASLKAARAREEVKKYTWDERARSILLSIQ